MYTVRLIASIHTKLFSVYHLLFTMRLMEYVCAENFCFITFSVNSKIFFLFLESFFYPKLFFRYFVNINQLPPIVMTLWRRSRSNFSKNPFLIFKIKKLPIFNTSAFSSPLLLIHLFLRVTFYHWWIKKITNFQFTSWQPSLRR